MREWQKALLTVLVSTAVFLLICEGVLRFLPVRSIFLRQTVDAAHPYLHYAPNQDFVFSDGSLLTNVNHGHFNNYGFVNDRDYDPADPRPLLAVIGDSYIEAAMVAFPQTVEARLADAAGPSRRVYSFAVSGAQLTDFLAYSEFAHDTFHARAMVVNVVNRDFDESLLRYKQVPGFHYYAEKPDGSLSLTLLDYQASRWRPVLRHSALARYLLLNIGSTPIGYRLKYWLAGIFGLAPYGPFNGPPVEDAERIALSKRAVDQVLSEFPVRSGLEPSRILFLVDGYRVFDPAGLAEAEKSYFGVIRGYFIAQARARGFEVADLQDWFARRHAADGAVFQFPDDGHWNANGHEEAAKAVEASRVWQDFIAQP